MIVAFEVGNTNISVGVYNKESKAWKQWRIKTDVDKTFDEYGILFMQLFEHHRISLKEVEGIILSSVVPEIMFNLETGIRKYLKLEPIIVTSDLDLGINIKYDNPRQLGVDRICNAVAAYSMYGGPVIIVDMGTATTICAVNKDGDFLGGSILPGIRSMIDALTIKAPKLPKILIDKPLKAIGTNTADGINGGIVYGYASMIDGLIRRFKKEMKEDNITVIGTGGLIQTISDEVGSINEIYDNLSLEGLRILFERNK